ncbi:L-ribulose-5-phosphate 3-epimerase [Wansuia hejianensis]|uniref:L-ribulose-5-phosphate 3-epimerase n=1 Tax=Wansuia hejianensis TaxID=2763667 RepID=A0A7G9G9A8_9FIRM|nr:L-ribulose-5-phosphate 3-epimerase [Wansuia hejianensis]QNM07390.1 L-ribulose-5-phosphate 3-epimerase [Wansuia hejianensis]RHV86314.1 L-ribulose-5-phosphate 3-epimerase [Lachnospiraceae bacterium OF09-33XD]
MKDYTIGLYEKAMPGTLSWREKMAAAGKAGYDFIEISIDETDEKLERLDMGRAERRKLVELMWETGLPIRTMCLSGHRKYPLGSESEAVRERGMQIMEKALILAGDLGIRIIQLAGYDVYYEQGNERTRALFLENLRKAADMAAARGILLGFETMETEFMNTVQKAMEIVRRMDSAYLNVYPDLGNITNAAADSGGNVQDDLETGQGRIIAMHLKETVPGKFREIPFGTGHVDFEKGIRKAWELGVRRYVTEFWYTGSPDWEQDLDYVARTMSAILDRQS